MSDDMLTRIESQTPPSRSRFLRLSAEIRLRIYSFVLVQPDDIQLKLRYYYDSYGHHERRTSSTLGTKSPSRKPRLLWINQCHHRPSPLSLLYVNRLVHKEATPVLYAQNCFAPTTDLELSLFFKMIGPRTEDIEILYLCWYKPSIPAKHLVPLTRAPKLRVIYLESSQLLRNCTDDRSLAQQGRTIAEDFKEVLLFLKASYKARKLTWRVFDVLWIRLRDLREVKKLDKIMESFREAAGGYLQDVEESDGEDAEEKGGRYSEEAEEESDGEETGHEANGEDSVNEADGEELEYETEMPRTRELWK